MNETRSEDFYGYIVWEGEGEGGEVFAASPFFFPQAKHFPREILFANIHRENAEVLS